jgi:predicted  nucleic acid-binding Zn-ribbon protein
MDAQFLKDWGSIIATFIALGGLFYTWLTAGSKTANAEIEKLKKSNADDFSRVREAVDAVETRLTKIESDMTHLPDEKAIMELKLDITTMKGSFGRMEESIAGITRTVHRVEDYLLNKGNHAG